MVITKNIDVEVEIDIEDYLGEMCDDAISNEIIRRCPRLTQHQMEALAELLRFNGYICVKPKYMVEEIALKEKIEELGL